jgi:hypothetical protein
MSNRNVATGFAALAIAAVPAVALAKPTPIHSKLFRNKLGTVTCGVEIPLPGHHAHWVLCSAVGIPPAKTGTGDPFVQVARTGKPQLVLVSQDEYETNHATVLGTGSSWGKLGVVCTVAGKTVTCTNHGGHGFTIGNHKYKSF